MSDLKFISNYTPCAILIKIVDCDKVIMGGVIC